VSVHFTIAALVEQTASVQDADMAVEAMHAVANVQTEVEAGSQQPCTAK